MTEIRKRRTVTSSAAIALMPMRRGGDNWEFCTQLFLDEERLKGRRERTLKLHQENLIAIRHLLEKLGHDVPPAEIRPDHLKGVVLEMVRGGKSSRTINLRRQTAKAFFACLARERVIPADPAAGLAKHREDRKLPKTLKDHGEIARLLHTQDLGTFSGLRDHVMIMLQLDTGIRLGELLALRLSDVDLGRKTLRVSAGTNKAHQEREIPFSHPTKEALREYLRERGALETDRVFISRDGTPLAPSSYQQNLRRHGQAAGLKGVSPHCLRHTFARLYIVNGGNPLALKKILGHADMDMVEWYVQLWGTDLQKMHAQFSPISRLIPNDKKTA